ncbi:MAG: hypothetical protein ACO3YN_09240 [Rubrivivax sp.]
MITPTPSTLGSRVAHPPTDDTRPELSAFATASLPSSGTAVVIHGLCVTGVDLPRDRIDACGGMTLCLPAARSLVLDTAELQFLDLLDCPDLESVDLSALGGGVHLTLRGCPRLKKVRLARHGGAHVHLDAGAQPPSALQITGSIGQFDACWGPRGRYMRKARAGVPLLGLHFGTEAPEPTNGLATQDVNPADPATADDGSDAMVDLVALIGARPDDPATGVLCIGTGLTGCRDLCLIDAADTLLAVEWTGGALREFAVEGARGLMVARLSAPVEHLLLSHCPRLRAVTTEDAPAGEVVLRDCCTAPAAPRPMPGAPRIRPSLVVDAPCRTLSLLDSGFETLRVFHATALLVMRCAQLARARLEEGSVVRCVGSPPWSVIDHLDAEGAEIEVDEGLIARLRDGVVRQHHRAVQRLERLMSWPMSPRSRVAALQALCTLLDTPLPRQTLWALRCALYRAQRSEWHMGHVGPWDWLLPDDQFEDGYRSDFRLWAACHGGDLTDDAAQAMADGLLGGPGRLAQSLMPWLATDPTPQGWHFLGMVLRRAASDDNPSENAAAAGSQTLHALLRILGRPARAQAGTHPRHRHPELFDAARAFYTRRAEEPAQLRWLEFEMRHDRPGTQARIALMLRTPARPGDPPMTPRHRATLTTLMLTGTLPARSFAAAAVAA